MRRVAKPPMGLGQYYAENSDFDTSRSTAPKLAFLP